MSRPGNTDSGTCSRRTAAATIGGSALASLGSRPAETCAAAPGAVDIQPLAHFAGKAKHLICLHMIGAPSQLDLFDDKPELVRRHGQPCPESVTRN
ncbi:MAG: DUF1501 domain-containing protein, partial [Planctomycetaceae bacterium]